MEISYKETEMGDNFLSTVNIKFLPGADELIQFINTHKDWQILLKQPPYNFKTIKNDPNNPTFWIFNYNLFDSDFKQPEVRQARGIVLDIQDDKVVGVVCHAFDKFFNYGDPMAADIDWKTAVVQEKIDGQICKLSRYKGKLYWFTNGAFGLNTPVDYTDDKVKNYEDLVKIALGNNLDWMDAILEGDTYMFELTSRYNHIIVNYDEPKLTFLGAINNTLNGMKEMRMVHDCEDFLDLPYDKPKVYDAHNIEDVKELLKNFNGKEQEGVVVVDEHHNRIKIKCDDYLHIKYMLGEDGLTDDKLLLAILNSEEDDLIELGISGVSERINEMRRKISYYESAVVNEFFPRAKAKFNELGGSGKAFADWVMSTPEKTLWFNIVKYDTAEKYIADLWARIKDKKHPYEAFINDTFFKVL